MALWSAAAATAGGARPRTVAELEGEIEAQLDAAETKGDRKLPVLTKRVADGAIKEPEHVAKVLRSGTPQRVDRYEDTSGPLAETMQRSGYRAAVAAPVVSRSE